MSESSWEEEKQRSREAKERALHARYHLLAISGSQYAVITIGSWSEMKDQEFVHFRLVPGLERVKHRIAIRAVNELNRGDTTEESYVSK